MKVALDAMGGDHAPQNTIFGAKLALRDFPNIEKLYLVGDEKIVTKTAKRYGLKDKRMQVVHAEETVEMSDKSVEAVRRKKKSSISVSVDLVKNGEADAIVSAGHTGASVAATTIKLRLIPGIDRPAIGSSLPNDHGTCVLIDVGANIEPKPIHLFHNAIMGATYSKYVYNNEKPKVGLLTFGGEESKLTRSNKIVYEMLSESSLNFVGNIEGNDLFEKDLSVVVTDGYVGNIVLKSCEATARIFAKWLRAELSKSVIRKMSALFLRKAFKVVKKRGNYETYGGSPLLGINGSCIICHGGSSAVAIKNAIKYAGQTFRHEVVPRIKEEVERNAEIVQKICQN